MSQWQPIETAPMDGTVIILSNTERGGSWVGHYIERYTTGFTPANHWQPITLHLKWHPKPNGSLIPTVWMPLPPPPQQEEGQNR